MKIRRPKPWAAHIFAAAVISACALNSSPAARAAMPDKPVAQAQTGRALFKEKGCYECHGWGGQGALGVAPAIAPPPLSAEAMEAYIRHPSGEMPPYSTAAVSHEQFKAIFDYLQSLPIGGDAAHIPALARFAQPAAPGSKAAGAGKLRPSDPIVDRGRTIYNSNCAGCHGAGLEGGFGPRLKSAGLPAEFVVQMLHHPPARMPTLYPSPLGESDVDAVARYVAQESRPAEGRQ